MSGATFPTWFAVGSRLTSVHSQPQHEVPAAFALQQNYPNPFNPSTDITYTVGGTGAQGSATSVRLAVYDVLGREVSVLVNERKPPGTYQIRFDATGLSSGAYYYRLTAGSMTRTRAMMLVR